MKDAYIKIDVLTNRGEIALTINDHLLSGKSVSGSWHTLYSWVVKLSEINAISKRLVFDIKTGEITNPN
jgi:hypothetical protein